MATIGDVLTQLVQSAPGLSDDNRAEYLAAVAEAYPAPQPAEADVSQAEADVAAAEAALAAAKAATSGVVN